ncbi:MULTISPECIES: hypothetical protein [unclassified Streptomyces]|uniref:hypothetical protein n=1 Tax=unclassified Streptomyces TaxID=2593676 RepID=UPI0006BEC925|nr:MULTISPECIES: hypothetical protein [unclassified Streptomyces]KOX26004.1 hypothetical protein ADL06_17040 [Streptomyces sp. NRRL F-6491]KOX42434.1 hypothetical protein ADL08_15790 [Streptomyces sp. NRRL F-6492]
MKHAKALAVLALALAVSGCSQPEEEAVRAFEVPDSLCGTPVAPDLLSPLLPAGGEKIEVRQRDAAVRDALGCSVVVDNTVVLSSSWGWEEIETNPGREARENPYVRRDKYESKDGTYVYAERGGVGKVTCEPVKQHRKGEMELYLGIIVSDPGRPDAAAVEKLLKAYAKALEKLPQCVQK